MGEYHNRYGRRFGRGGRPVLIVLKVLAVVAFGGGLLAVSALLHTAAAGSGVLTAVRSLFHWLIIPGATAAVVLGGLLLLPHASILLRARWLRAKLVLVLIGLPAAHVLGYLALRRADATGEPRMLALVVDGTIALLIVLVILGRQKPRLGERYGTRTARVV